MAHGFATERTFGLQPFVERFIGAGWAVLTFDYRGFGESEGEPRLLVSPKKHI
jgi:alpha-beta hydrolase superfamily lysophospholipase